jgi:MYXO-CTERM domain-containing protein
VSITVSDGANETVETFNLLVNDLNGTPTISDIDDVTIDENTESDPIAFTIGDVDDVAGDLVVTAKSSKHSLLADDGITLGGKGANRTVEVKPIADQTGTVDVTITVSDGTHSRSTKFKVTVKAVEQQNPDAGTMTSDAGAPDASTGAGGSGGSSGSGGNPSTGEDASTGAAGGEDASTATPDSDAGETDAGTQKLSGGGGDCGCSTVGATTRPSGAVMGTLLALFGTASWRRRRKLGR